MGKISHALVMEDGALVHQSKTLEEWRKLQLIQKLEWPIDNLDINPLENI